jgi:hypothetical protein
MAVALKQPLVRRDIPTSIAGIDLQFQGLLRKHSRLLQTR